MKKVLVKMNAYHSFVINRKSEEGELCHEYAMYVVKVPILETFVAML